MRELTPRQLAVVALRCEFGLNRQQLAEALFVNPTTIKKHWTHIIERTGATSAQVCYRYGRGDFRDTRS